jgi:hypothetical protein
MKKEELYNKTVDILVQAYLNDTLQHENCYACAVGNIIAANLNLNIIQDGDIKMWEGYGSAKKQVNWFNGLRGYSYSSKEEFEREVESTGYSVLELDRIERAFEGASCYGDRMFNGLMAVIDVLDKIHENQDTLVTAAQKERFKKELV